SDEDQRRRAGGRRRRRPGGRRRHAVRGEAVMLRPPLWKVDLARLPGALGRLGAKEMHLWLASWLVDRARTRLAGRRAPSAAAPAHVFFAVCDHYEPLHDGVSAERARARVAAWRS